MSKPCRDAVLTLRHVLNNNEYPRVAQIGVGVGATTLAMAKMMRNRGELHIFDYVETVTELTRDLKNKGIQNIRPHGHSRKTLDSYNWSLAPLLLDIKSRKAKAFDFVFLKGEHNFPTDGLAVALCIRMLKSGGYILIDDLNWTYDSSRTMHPAKNLQVSQRFTTKQTATQQLRLVCELFLDDSQMFTHETFDGSINSDRVLFRKIPPPRHTNSALSGIKATWALLSNFRRRDYGS
jgi:predicted O-methyltransferase YrrM